MPGADPGFLERGFKFTKGGGGRFSAFTLIDFYENPHENEIILSKRGIRSNPLNPLWTWEIPEVFTLRYEGSPLAQLRLP